MADKKSVEFKLYAPEAKKVYLAGDFNKWKANEIKLRKDSKGTWKAKLELKPGRYEYKFVVDGNWWTDPNSTSVPNSLGSHNSVAIV